MELAKDLMAGLRGRVQPVGPGAEMRGLDWHGLHARLSAAHAARTVMASGESAAGIAVGGFECWASSAHPAVTPCQRVNLTDSTDGKAGSGKAVDVAEQLAVGD